jgi:hypothetical protein
MRRVLAFLIAAVALAVSASAQTALITVKWEKEQIGPNPKGETTLYDDGTISTTVHGLWPDPPDKTIPPSVIPPGAQPAGEDKDVGPISGGDDAVAAAVGVRIGIYLLGEWIDYGIEALKEALEGLIHGESVGSDFNEKVIDEIILYLRQNS